MIESTRAAWGASAVDRCKICKDHGPGMASDLLRGGLGGPSLGLDVLEDCAPSAAASSTSECALSFAVVTEWPVGV